MDTYSFPPQGSTAIESGAERYQALLYPGYGTYWNGVQSLLYRYCRTNPTVQLMMGFYR